MRAHPPGHRRWAARLAVVLAIAVSVAFTEARASGDSGGRSISGTGFEWPTSDTIWRTVLLRDHNTRTVFAGVTTLGAAAGIVGTFLLLRKRSLLSDTVSHSTMPGIATAFIVAESLGANGRSLPVLLGGAVGSGILGMLSVAMIRRGTRLKDDAALAIVLSVFFGLGMALLVIVQQMPSGNVAGLSQFIYGKAASMTTGDAAFILAASLFVAAVCGALFKELKLLCFDADFARAQGWPVLALDLALMTLVVGVTVIGLQAVGLLLVVALLIIPPAAARFWTHRLGLTAALATAIGAASGLAGVTISALFPRLPAGAVVVLTATFAFAASFIFGAERGWIVRWRRRVAVARRVRRQHLLRAAYQWCENQPDAHERGSGLLDRDLPWEAIAASNHWTPSHAARLRRQGTAEGLITPGAGHGSLRLTPQGRLEARRATRNHRLWETYLLQYADVAPQHLHHNADQIEHVVDPVVVNELEELLADRYGALSVPAEPGPEARTLERPAT